MFGFSIEFKKWYVVFRGPKGRVYLAFGCAENIPYFTSTKDYSAYEYGDWIEEDDDDDDDKVNSLG